jgi:hypothetical protein
MLQKLGIKPFKSSKPREPATGKTCFFRSNELSRHWQNLELSDLNSFIPEKYLFRPEAQHGTANNLQIVYKY